MLLEFGEYFVVKQNCHRFCTLYLQELGLRTGLLEEDTDKAIVAGLVVVAALAFVCLYKIKST